MSSLPGSLRKTSEKGLDTTMYVAEVMFRRVPRGALCAAAAAQADGDGRSQRPQDGTRLLHLRREVACRALPARGGVPTRPARVLELEPAAPGACHADSRSCPGLQACHRGKRRSEDFSMEEAPISVIRVWRDSSGTTNR